MIMKIDSQKKVIFQSPGAQGIGLI